MKPYRLDRFAGMALVAFTVMGNSGLADHHGVALYGAPALAPGFTHLPYVNSQAPKGGRFVDGQVGSFDSLNPYVQKGRVPWQLRFLTSESLLGRSWDEPFTLYARLAESVDIGPGNDSITFHLNPAARFSDGSPVTVEDVLWSFETLGTQGHGRYRGSWAHVARAQAVGERSVRFTLDKPDRELAMTLGLRPILKKAQWEGVDFAAGGLGPVPIGSAPYVITDFQVGRFVELTRNRDYWGRDLPFRRGTHNIDTIRMEFFGDATALFEAFKAAELDTIREPSAVRWDRHYDFPRIRTGEAVKSIIPHQRPSGITGLVMNTRTGFLADWRVRQALIEAFNFEYINRTLNDSIQPRIVSYFGNSPLGLVPGPAQGEVAALLAPWTDHLLPGTLEGYTLPVSDGKASDRAGLRRASALLATAGYTLDNGRLIGPQGAPVEMEILLPQGKDEIKSLVEIYVVALKRLGLAPRVSVVDSAQYKERTDAFDFDMAHYRRGLSLSPGNEQMEYWGGNSANTPGSRNWMGARNPAIDAMIDAMLSAPTQESYVAAVRALDRVLVAGRYVVPIWHSPISRIAHDAGLEYPADRLPIYGDWIGFQPDVWWRRVD